MSLLRPGDEALHYRDGSHCWIPPNPVTDQAAWEAAVRAHMQRHRDLVGGPEPRRTASTTTAR